MALNKKTNISDSVNNDFVAVDAAVDEIAQTHGAENAILRSQAWRRFFKWGGIFLIALAISCLILAQAYWSLNRPYPKQVATSESAENLKEKYNSENVVENFVKFTEITHEYYQVSNVTIGRSYEHENDSKPSRQWCYVNDGSSNAASRNRLDLAESPSSSPIPTLEELKKFGLSFSEYEKLKKYCVFD
jgi:hypothetical protein